MFAAFLVEGTLEIAQHALQDHFHCRAWSSLSLDELKGVIAKAELRGSPFRSVQNFDYGVN
jgi:hypothetical protein